MKMRGTGIPNLVQFRRMLGEKGLKATPQRLSVHEAMIDLGHASAEDVSKYLAERGTPVATATVYNILSALADLKIYGRCSGRSNKMYHTHFMLL